MKIKKLIGIKVNQLVKILNILKDNMII